MEGVPLLSPPTESPVRVGAAGWSARNHTSIEVRERLSPYLSQRLHRVAVHLGDARHRIALRKHTTEARSNQQIAALDVCVGRQVGQRE